MPLLKITTSVPPSLEHGKLLANLSQLCASRLGKPESCMMTAMEHPSLTTFGGTTDPVCYVELNSSESTAA